MNEKWLSFLPIQYLHFRKCLSYSLFAINGIVVSDVDVYAFRARSRLTDSFRESLSRHLTTRNNQLANVFGVFSSLFRAAFLSCQVFAPQTAANERRTHANKIIEMKSIFVHHYNFLKQFCAACSSASARGACGATLAHSARSTFRRPSHRNKAINLYRGTFIRITNNYCAHCICPSVDYWFMNRSEVQSNVNCFLIYLCITAFIVRFDCMSK